MERPELTKCYNCIHLFHWYFYWSLESWVMSSQNCSFFEKTNSFFHDLVILHIINHVPHNQRVRHLEALLRFLETPLLPYFSMSQNTVITCLFNKHECCVPFCVMWWQAKEKERDTAPPWSGGPTLPIGQDLCHDTNTKEGVTHKYKNKYVRLWRTHSAIGQDFCHDTKVKLQMNYQLLMELHN